jgi:capsular polysaccharide biosynthesis protein
MKTMLSLFRPRVQPFPVFFLIAVIVFVLVVLQGVLLTFLAPKTYASVARIILDYKIVHPPQRFFSDPYLLLNEIETMQSHEVLAKAVEKLDLRDIWGRKYGGDEPLQSPKAEALLKRRLYLHIIQNTKYVEIRVIGETPEEAARLANGVADSYIEFKAREFQQHPDVMTITTATMTNRAEINHDPVAPNGPIAVGVLVGILLGPVAGAVTLGIIAAIRKKSNPAESYPG